MRVPLPTSLLAAIFARWLDRQQQVTEYLKTENEILRSQLSGRTPRLTDEERGRLAVKGKALGRKLLAEVACIVTPETILVMASAAGKAEMDLSTAQCRATAARGNA